MLRVSTGLSCAFQTPVFTNLLQNRCLGMQTRCLSNVRTSVKEKENLEETFKRTPDKNCIRVEDKDLNIDPFEAKMQSWLDSEGQTGISNSQNQQTASARSKTELNPDGDLIYMLPHARYASLLNRVKMQQTVLMALTFPAASFTYGLNVIPLEVVSSIGVFGVIVNTVLHISGYLCNNLVAFVYFKQKSDTLKISYVSYWGQRIDINVNVSDVIPRSEMPSSIMDPLFKKVMFTFGKPVLKLSQPYGEIKDAKRFFRIF